MKRLAVLLLGVVSSVSAVEAPIDITSNDLEYHREGNYALFKGNVKVTQGQLALGADALKVLYKNKKGLEKVEANGHVTVVHGENTATAETAVYSPTTGIVTMAGNVKMKRGENTLTGEKLAYNPATGTMQMANDGGKERVRASFTLEKTEEN